MSPIVVIQLASVLATVLVGVTTGLLNYRSTARTRAAEMNVQNRTISLDELEKALVFTGNQLTDLRTRDINRETELRGLHAQILELQEQHEDCKRENRRLDREIRELRNGGRHA